MSLGYAERLSHRDDLGGRLGDPELSDAPHEVLDKANRLADVIRDAKKVIVFTGAGISTACGIPDFRGPQGVWTLQRKGLPLPKLQTSFVYAKPSLTHQALLGMMQKGNLAYICSQNVDSLHLRSGVPRDQLAELHGNCFAERCKKCKTEYVRDFEMDTVGFKQTGRRCTQPGCRGMLVDHILDWEDALPPAELKATQQHASSSDVALCLGTSLQIIPAANLPLRTVKAGGKLAIINLQETPKDKKAEVVIHSRVDEVMALIMSRVGLGIPVYTRTDRVLLSHTYTAGSSGSSQATNRMSGASSSQQQAVEDAVKQEEHQQQGEHQQQSGPGDMSGTSGPAAADTSLSTAGAAADAAVKAEAAAAAATTETTGAAGADDDDGDAAGTTSSGCSNSSSWGFTLTISSIHGASCPLPMVASASVSFLGAAAAVLKPRELSGQLPWKLNRSCPADLQEVVVLVQLQLVEAADEDKRIQQVQYVISKPQQQQLDASSSRAKTTRRAATQQQADGSQVFAFVTQQLDYTEKQQQLVEQLEAAAEQSRSAAPAADTAAPAAAAPSRKRPSKGNSKGGSSGNDSKQQQQQQQQQTSGIEGADADEAAICSNGQSKAGNKGNQASDSADAANRSAGGGSGNHAQASSLGDEEGTSSEDEGSSDGDDDDDKDSDFAASDSSDVEPTGHNGQNTSGRPRKRTKRLDL